MSTIFKHQPPTPQRSDAASPPLFRSITWILLIVCSSFVSYYVGVWTGRLATSDTDTDRSERESNIISDEQLHRKAEALAKKKFEAQREYLCKKVNSPPEASQTSERKGKGVFRLFPSSLSHFVRGLVRVGKDDLMRTFDFGVPPTSNTEGLDALLFYNHRRALPSDENVARAARFEDPADPLPLLTAESATENCDTMNVALVDNPENTRQCLVLVGGQYQSYHVQRWMRRDDRGGGLDPEMPLRLTSRAFTASGRMEFRPPERAHVKANQENIRTYLTEAAGVKSRLKKTLEEMNVKTVVLLTCNLGQSELLMNFACSARARGLDLKSVLVFPTDMETKKLAEGIGLRAFYEEKMMASVPKNEARLYGNKKFTDVMFAKVLCVQLVNELGYDLLFQDVDIVWYKDPLVYFHDESLPKFDVYFQDDGSRQERYAPYSANSGFYYARSNDRTRHLFRRLLYSGELIKAWGSHQSVLNMLLAELSSLTGLSVKVFPREMEEFPGGWQYQRRKDLMEKIMNGKSNAYIFHMSWTLNKDMKVNFLEQMGEWYLKEKCIGRQAHEINAKKGETSGPNNDGMLTKHCCTAEPLIICHYRDKPSKIPCLDSPSINAKGGPTSVKRGTPRLQVDRKHV